MKYKYNGQWYDLSIKALDGMPIGAIIAYPSANIPDGWLECNGSSITSANYPELYDLIGGTLPNYKGRVLVGQDTSDTDFDTLGETGGSKELQQHYHYMTWNTGSGPNKSAIQWVSSTNGTQNVPTATDGTGDSGNLQPYIVCKWIIKAKQTTPLIASVLNSNSNSTTDTYSCDYINDLFPTDNLPVGTIAEYTGQVADIPNGWVQIDPEEEDIYSNSGGATGNFVLTKNVTNFKAIEISYATNDGNSGTKRIINNGASSFNAELFEMWTSGNTGDIIYFKTCRLIFNGTNVTYSEGYESYINSNGFTRTTSTNIRIYRVTGYR